MRERNRVVTLFPAQQTQITESHLIVPGNPPWTTVVHPSDLTPESYVEEYCRDEVIPNWKEQIANGAIINNPYFKSTRTFYNVRPAQLSYHAERLDGGVDVKGYKYNGTVVPFKQMNNLPGILQTFPDVEGMATRVTELAVTQAHSKVGNPDILIGATLAEGQKTIQTLVDVTQRAIIIARKVRKLDLRRDKLILSAGKKSRTSRDRLRDEFSLGKLENDYMQARYGLRPIVYDVNGLVKAVKTPKQFVRQTARGQAEDFATFSDTLHNVPFWYDCQVDLERIISVRITARAGVLCAYDRTWSHALGLGQLSVTAWELLPFSFILDWVWNIGNTIAAHQPKVGTNQLASWVTTKETWSSLNRVTDARLTAGIVASWPVAHSASVSAPAYGEVRNTTTRVPSPVLRTWPRFDVNVSMFKLLDLGIILKNILR